jgi:hypothetical protein
VLKVKPKGKGEKEAGGAGEDAGGRRSSSFRWRRAEDAPSRRMLEARSFHKVQSMDGTTACLLSSIDSGNFIALDDDEDDEL